MQRLSCLNVFAVTLVW